MDQTLQATLNDYSARLVREIKKGRRGFDPTFIPFVLNDDIVELVPNEYDDLQVYGFVHGYVLARVSASFATN